MISEISMIIFNANAVHSNIPNVGPLSGRGGADKQKKT